jgi:hypothetical protein
MNCKTREKAAIANVAPKQNRTTPSLLTKGSYTRRPSRSHGISGPRDGLPVLAIDSVERAIAS